MLFTYTVGLASGPTFFPASAAVAPPWPALTAALIVVLAGLCAGAAEVLGLSPAERAGLFAGSATNTPALQAASRGRRRGDPVVAYSLAYPAAVAAMLVHRHPAARPAPAAARRDSNRPRRRRAADGS